MPCRINRNRRWTAKLIMESRMHAPGTCFFSTFTYDDLHLPALADSQWTLDRRAGTEFRYRLWDALGKRVPFFWVGEYGNTGERAPFNPHYHAMWFGIPLVDPHEVLTKAWGQGFVSCSWFSKTRAAYCAQYCIKKLSHKDDGRLDGPRHPEFAQMSRRPALGDSFLHAHMCAWLRSDAGKRWIDRNGDVPSSFRSEGGSWPIGDRHRRSLRAAAGLPLTRELVYAERGEFPPIDPFPSIEELHNRGILFEKREARAKVFRSQTRRI